MASAGESESSSARPWSGLSATPVQVEVAAHPTGHQVGLRRSDLPVMAAREMRLVRIGVPDGGHHADLALAVELRERRGEGVPEEARVLGEGRAGALRERERRAEFRVQRIPCRIEHGHRVDPALQVHADEDAVARRLRGARDPVLEGRSAEQPAGAVDREEKAGGHEHEAAAREAGAGGGRHPRLDARQPGSGLRHAAPQELGAVEVSAGAGAVVHPGSAGVVVGAGDDERA